MRRIIVIATTLAAGIVLAGACLAGGPSVQKLNENARIDWTNLVYVATGEGAVPSVNEEPNRARAYLKAKGYARMAAIANLLAAIEGTTISYEAVGKDYMEDATIRQKIEGFVRNVEVTRTTEEKVEGDTMIVVEVRAPVFGQNAPGSVLLGRERLKQAGGEVRVTTKFDSRPLQSTDIDAAKPSDPSMPYTSVIIDTRGFKLDRCMSPKIRRADGTEIWGSMNVSMDVVLERGIASYVTSLEDGRKNPRAGSNPLIIRAIGRAGGKFNSDPVISDADAELLLAENAKSGFLNKLNVIIVKDGRL